MNTRREAVEIFGRCSRILNKIAMTAGDKFFARLCTKESDKLLSDFVLFLKGDNVAQSRQKLIFRIRNVLNFVDVLDHLQLTPKPTSLLLRKNLLSFELFLLNLNSNSKLPMKPKITPVGNGKPPVKKSIKGLKFGESHKLISNFISIRGEVQNSEIFTQFSDISKRTLKRKLSELIKSGSIRRFTKGKHVFYTT